MACLVKNTLIKDLVCWSVVHPNLAVTLTYRRKPSGESYVTCTPPSNTYNKPLFTSVPNISYIMDTVSNWVEGGYQNYSLTNEWGLPVAGGDGEDRSRTTLVHSLHNNVPKIDVGVWFRRQTSDVFSASLHSFSVFGKRDIELFIRMNTEFQRRIENVIAVSYTHLRAHETPEHL